VALPQVPQRNGLGTIAGSRAVTGGFGTSMAEKSITPQISPRLFAQIRDASSNLIALRTIDRNTALDDFSRLASREGQVIYLWSPGKGLVSMRESQVKIPGSQHLLGALRHVAASIHMGIYLFIDFKRQLSAQSAVVLRKIVRGGGESGRKIVFLGGEVSLPEDLEASLLRLGTDAPAAALRLRDGHWLT
jgi:hypothetical protein